MVEGRSPFARSCTRPSFVSCELFGMPSRTFELGASGAVIQLDVARPADFIGGPGTTRAANRPIFKICSHEAGHALTATLPGNKLAWRDCRAVRRWTLFLAYAWG